MCIWFPPRAETSKLGPAAREQGTYDGSVGALPPSHTFKRTDEYTDKNRLHKPPRRHLSEARAPQFGTVKSAWLAWAGLGEWMSQSSISSPPLTLATRAGRCYLTPMNAGEALERFLAANRIDRRGYESARFRVRLGPITLVFPNPGKLPIHDLHHVALGVPATFWGEVEISAFELGIYPSALITLLCVGALALGGLLAPLRVRSMWRRYAGCRNLYRSGRPTASSSPPISTTCAARMHLPAPRLLGQSPTALSS